MQGQFPGSSSGHQAGLPVVASESTAFDRFMYTAIHWLLGLVAIVFFAVLILACPGGKDNYLLRMFRQGTEKNSFKH